jgi:hypothetical protein
MFLMTLLHSASYFVSLLFQFLTFVFPLALTPLELCYLAVSLRLAVLD